MATKKAAKKATKKAVKTATKKVKRKAAPTKYLLPSGETWSGRGRIPASFSEWEDSYEGMAWREDNGKWFPPVGVRYRPPSKKTLEEIKIKNRRWRVAISGTALVRADFEVKAGSLDEAWKEARAEFNWRSFGEDDLKFFEIRLNDEIDDVYEV